MGGSRPVLLRQPESRKAFTTDSTWLPSGIASADALCTDEASAANLPGTYRALLAGEGFSAASRFNTTGLPWARIDGPLLAPTAADFFTMPLLDMAPNVSADGLNYYTDQGVWSGARNMNDAGTLSRTCGNWASNTGSTWIGAPGIAYPFYFFGFSGQSCSSYLRRLICLQE